MLLLCVLELATLSFCEGLRIFSLIVPNSHYIFHCSVNQTRLMIQDDIQRPQSGYKIMFALRILLGEKILRKQN